MPAQKVERVVAVFATTFGASAELPGALATRERVRPPSMTRVIASLVELGRVERSSHPDDRRQVLVVVSKAGEELFEAERRAGMEWLQGRLEKLKQEDRATLLAAADLMFAIIDEAQ